VQELLGHASVTTTMIYTHVLNKGPLVWAVTLSRDDFVMIKSGLLTLLSEADLVVVEVSVQRPQNKDN
jgi:hypothetical protein